MKTIKYLLPVIALFFMVSCDSDDDDFYNTVYANTENSVIIETLPAYTVGDVLRIDANLPRLVDEVGQPNPLDIRATTGNAPSFVFTFNLERRTGVDTWEFVDMTDSFINEIGNSMVGSFVQAEATFDSSSDSYEFSGAIPLLQTGEYRLSFGYNTAVDRVEMISNSQGNNITLNIASSIAALDLSGYYSFTVN